MSDWESKTLDTLVITPITYGVVKPGDIVSDGIPFIRSGDISAGKIAIENLRTISKAVSKQYSRTLLKGGELIISLVGNPGQVAIVPPYLAGANIARQVGLIRLSNIVNTKFVMYYFMSSGGKEELHTQIGGSVQQVINLKDLKKVRIALPSILEQKAIAAVLSSLDDKIDLLQRQNQTLEALAQTLFRQWFIEEAQDKWDEVKLGEILTILESGSRPKGGIDPNLKNGIPSVGAESINGLGNYDYSRTKLITTEYFEKMKRGKVKDYDVLIYKDGAYIGKKSMFAKGFPFKKCAVNEHVFILRTESIPLQLFLYFALEQDELALLNTNTAQPGLNQTSMKSFELMSPNSESIEIFGQTVKPFIDKIFFNGKQILTLEKLRDTLLPKLIIGEVRVRL